MATISIQPSSSLHINLYDFHTRANKVVQRKCVHVVAFISHKFKTSVDRYDKKNYKSVTEYKHFDDSYN